MCALHNNSYNVSKAIASLVPAGGPILCRDEMEEWSAGQSYFRFCIQRSVIVNECFEILVVQLIVHNNLYKNYVIYRR